MSTRSPTSYGCFTNRKMHDPRISWAVVAKTKDKDSNAAPAVARVVDRFELRKATASGVSPPRSRSYALRNRPLTEDKDHHHEDDGAEKLIESMNRLVHIRQ